MKKYLIVLLIALTASAAIFLLFNQGLFTTADEVIELKDGDVNVEDDTLGPVEEENVVVEEEIVVDAPEEEAAGEEREPEGGEGPNASDDTGFTTTDFPFQDFIQAREQGEPIVLKFYSET